MDPSQGPKPNYARGEAPGFVVIEFRTQLVFKLYEKNSKTLIARYRDSRRDWAIPLPEVVIHRAKMEIFASGLHMINIIMFSFLVTEILRRDRSPDVMDLATANNVARMEGAYSIFA